MNIHDMLNDISFEGTPFKIKCIEDQLVIKNLPVNRYVYSQLEYEDLRRIEGVFEISDNERPVRVLLSRIKTLEYVTFRGRVLSEATLVDGSTIFVIV